MPKGIPNKRYTPEFKQQVVEAVMQDGLSYKEAARRYDVQGHDRIQSWVNTPPETVPLDRTNGALRPLKWCMVTAVMVH